MYHIAWAKRRYIDWPVSRSIACLQERIQLIFLCAKLPARTPQTQQRGSAGNTNVPRALLLQSCCRWLNIDPEVEQLCQEINTSLSWRAVISTCKFEESSINVLYYLTNLFQYLASQQMELHGSLQTFYSFEHPALLIIVDDHGSAIFKTLKVIVAQRDSMNLKTRCDSSWKNENNA